MPISDTLRRLDNDIVINADGLQVSGPTAGKLGAVYEGTLADPNGGIVAAKPALYYNRETGSVWMKTTTASNTGWVQLIAP